MYMYIHVHVYVHVVKEDVYIVVHVVAVHSQDSILLSKRTVLQNWLLALYENFIHMELPTKPVYIQSRGN